MKLLIYLFIFNSQSSIIQGDDSTRLQKFISQSEISLNLSYLKVLIPKKQVSSIDPKAEHDFMIENNIPDVGVSINPSNLCYAYQTGFGVFSGVYIKSPIKIKKINFHILTGVNFYYGKSVFFSSVEKPKELYQLHLDYLNSMGNGSYISRYEFDTTIVEKVVSGASCMVPLSVSFMFYKKWSLEAGALFAFANYGKKKLIDENSHETLINLRFLPYFQSQIALNYQILKRLSIQLGYIPKRVVFGSIRFRLNS